MKDKKKVVISIVAVLVLVVLVIGVTYAAFTFSKAGATVNSVTTGTVTMTYTEGKNGITINNAMPMEDSVGKVLTETSQMFDFTVDINIVGKTAIAYEVTAEKADSSTLTNDEVRLYLEKSIDGTNYEEVMAPSNYSGITANDDFGAKSGEMVMDTGNVSVSTTNYYRLRMWVAKSYELTGTAKTFTVKVNVYGKTGIYEEKPINKTCSGSNCPVCYYATSLHNDGTHTYGSLGTSGTLVSGDAFDCDVNGDGTYDSSTERFYYVDDNNTDTATLIYSNNTVSGEINNTTTIAYDAGGNAYTNGPVTAVKHLPMISQWSNISLKNTTRDLTDELGTVRKAGFSYAGYAARLLTTQEVEKACKITVGSYTTGELDSCNYLMENTKYQDSGLQYGYLLENSTSSTSTGAWRVNASNRKINSGGASDPTNAGVRPVIEVPKSKISY